MSVRSNSKNLAKHVVLYSRIPLLIRPFADALTFLACLSRVVQWSLRARRTAPAAICETRPELYELVNRECVGARAIDYLEFGVWKGGSFKWWLTHNDDRDSTFTGFDTFTGLPEDWGYYKKGHFDVGGRVPRFDDPRAEFEVGLFQHTLLPFLKRRRLSNLKVINIDADLYSSTLFVLATLHPWLRPGDIVLMDEFLAWRTPADQYRAFEDYVNAFGIEYRFVGSALFFEKVAVEIVALPGVPATNAAAPEPSLRAGGTC